MSLTQKPSTNGTTAQPVPTPTNGKVQTTVPVVKLPVKEENSMPLDERLHKINLLFEVQTKYNRLQRSRQLLNDFKLKKDGETITLTLSDYNSRGNDFTTKNPDVIKEIIGCLKETIDKKIKDLEPKLNW